MKTTTLLQCITTLPTGAVLLLSACSSTIVQSPNQATISHEQPAPPMVFIRSGKFIMGSPGNEKGRYEDEGPQREVQFDNAFWLGQTPVTVAQFKRFIDATGYRTDAEKKNFSLLRSPLSGKWEEAPGVHWRHNHAGKINGDNYPVVHVSWHDATAYTNWLTRVTGKNYRLPSEAELEYAYRAGSNTRYWWGDSDPTEKVGNIKGQHDIPGNDKSWYPTIEERQYAYANGYTPVFFEAYNDGYWGLAPVASFKANAFGIFDATGNVWEWTRDCWHDSYHSAPKDGSAWIDGGACDRRVLRGGSFYCFPRHVRSANRWSQPVDRHMMYIGFRVARDNT